MVALLILYFYIILSIPIYILMRHLYNSKNIRALPAVKHKWLWYLIQFTWGLPMNVVGLVVALVFICFNKKPKKYGWCYCFELNTDWGLELGIFFIAPGDSNPTKNHEHGHAIQNIYLGPFAITCVSIPSCIRFWFRRIKKLINPSIKLKPYDSIWFEGQASDSGTKFIENLENINK